MKIKIGLEADYEKYKALNSTDAYSNRCVTYGEAWADLMEREMASGVGLTKELVDRTGHAADTDGITGYMHGAAAHGLGNFWEHGEAFRIAFNAGYVGEEKAKQMAKEKPGATVNPAIITIGEG